MKHVLILNCYDDELSDFRQYVDHRENRVSYISLIGRSRLIERSLCENVVEVSSLDGDIILPSAREMHAALPIDVVLAFSEYDLDAAAQLRSALDIPGAKEADNALCRNKTSMKAALATSSVYYQSVTSRANVMQFCHQYGYPAILKPQVGAASDGVVKLERDADIPALEDFAGYEVEEYIEGDIYHVDAILASGQMPYFKVSKYLNTCLDFRHGAPLGSVTVDNTAFIARAQALTGEVCTHLNLHNSGYSPGAYRAAR